MARKMNEIEKTFYDAFKNIIRENGHRVSEIKCQQPIGLYKVDFLYLNTVIEIDGHDFHSTKEQREKDYKKSRYLQKRGYTVIRFMGTEVFLDAEKCAEEAHNIAFVIDEKVVDAWDEGYKAGVVSQVGPSMRKTIARDLIMIRVKNYDDEDSEE